jgi:hypothetical protein
MVKRKETYMLKKIIFALACTLLALFLGSDFASAASKKPRWQVKNHPDIYSTHPNLPADVPYTNQRNRDWLGGYLSNSANEDDVNNEEEDDSVSTSPPHRRDWRERRRWRGRHGY